MLSYIENKCNVPGCDGKEYKHHMCKMHYDFYSENPLTAQYMKAEQALEDGTAGWKLKATVILQSIIHHTLNIPMPLIKHFPLEHVFLGELYYLRRAKTIDSERIQQVIADFNIDENENLSDMQRVLNIKDIETSELAAKEEYLLKKEDLPSKWPVIFSIIGLCLLYCFFRWIAGGDFQIRGAGIAQVAEVYRRFFPYACVLTLVILLGIMIPSQYNFFVERCYNLTLYKDVKDNADVVNQVKFVKERKVRAGSYYATILGTFFGTSTLIFWTLLGHGSPVTWLSVLFCIAVVLSVVPLVFSYNEMALFYPVIESLKRKRVAIDLFNADHRGGLKHYHRFLYLTFLYSEGLAVVLMTVYAMLPVSRWWVLLLILLILPRLNHAGWAIVGWVKSIKDFYKEKNAEQEKLEIQDGSAESMNKMELLKKVHPIGIIPFVLYLSSTILIPYMVNQLPKVSELLKVIGLDI